MRLKMIYKCEKCPVEYMGDFKINHVNKKWLGDPFETLTDAINHARSIGLSSFAIYKDGAVRYGDFAYEEIDGVGRYSE